jgi:hypothetical protein
MGKSNIAQRRNERSSYENVKKITQTGSFVASQRRCAV